jgi:hypothetical protein
MGILVPLYLAGLTALTLPLIFHLVRRTPRGRQVFSSLMFLSPTVPRLTRRSRIDQILLLLLRLAALALIAFAFSRPFLREAASLSFSDLAGKRVALLIDTSASMKRGDLWQQAIRTAEKHLDDLNPQDDVALFAFSDRVRTIIDFQREGAAPIADKPQVVRNRLRELIPNWRSTDLGTALVAVAGELDAASDVRQSPLEPQIVVISDFQGGSRIEALQSFEWPERVPVVPQLISLTNTTNAYAQVLSTEEGHELTDVRVRVVNAADSRRDQFTIGWSQFTVPPARGRATTVGAKAEPRTDVYVPPGQSRVIRLPRGADSLTADRIVLRGDDHDFDNTFYVVPPRKLDATLLYVGRDSADDPNGLQLYLRLAVANDPLRQVDVRPIDVSGQLSVPGSSPPELVVVSQLVSAELQLALTAYVERGGLLLLVPEDREAGESLTKFFDGVELGAEASTKEQSHEYQLLGEIDFTHPLFAPFASPRYSDFTKIHFWKHRPVTLKLPSTTRVAARFDNGSPALLERLVGQGRVLALTSGWQPEDSQFALSSKFVPFVGAILDLACGGNEIAESVSVGQPVAMHTTSQPSPNFVSTPDDREVRLDAGVSKFVETDQPGIYQAKVGSTESRFAVNLAAAESNTSPLELEQLEQRGVRIGVEQTRQERVERVRQQRDTELEGRQKVWRWLIVMALGTLILETWWAGRAERKITA